MGRLDKIAPFLWLGNQFAAIDEKRIRKFGISEILTVCVQPIKDGKRLKSIKYHHIPLDDSSTQDLLINLEEMLAILQAATDAEKNILVHCEAGVSRSAAICCAFLMRRNNDSFKAALKQVKAARYVACPNESFQRQLEIFEQLSRKADSETLNDSKDYQAWLIESRMSSWRKGRKKA